MGYAVGEADGRTIGYGVPAPCDYPGCDKEIDRGLGYKCETSYSYDEQTDEETYDSEGGCGLFFCLDHLFLNCPPEHDSIQPKPDPVGWHLWVLGHETWEQWRRENPRSVQAFRKEMEDPDLRAEAVAYINRHAFEEEAATILAALP